MLMSVLPKKRLSSRLGADASLARRETAYENQAIILRAGLMDNIVVCAEAYAVELLVAGDAAHKPAPRP